MLKRITVGVPMSIELVASLDAMVLTAADGGRTMPLPTRASIMREILEAEVARAARRARKDGAK